MSRKNNRPYYAQPHVYYVQTGPNRNYGCFSFLLDLFMFCVTGGLWIIWIIIRQWKNRR